MKIFSKYIKSKNNELPNFQMGRYSDIYHQEEKYYLWEKSFKNFENTKYIESYMYLFDFLKRETVENLSYKISKGQLFFKLFQGSKIIEGVADHIHFKAFAKIVHLSYPDINLMREILEANYTLEYCRFATDDSNYLLLVFDSFVEDASPQKIYNGLKELANSADKYDDLIVKKYKCASPINTDHIRPISHTEKLIKYQFFKEEINHLYNEQKKLEIQYLQYPGAMTYQILSFVYKIDFLLKPEGRIMEKIKYVHELHIGSNNMSVIEKNNQMMGYIQLLNDVSFEDFEKEIYEVISTFGEARSIKNDKIKNLINLHCEEARWYYENGFKNCALAIWDYVVGFVLYSYVLPKPIEDLFILYYQIRHHKIFSDLGLKANYYKNNGQIHLKNIKQEMNSILTKHKNNYTNTNIDNKKLKSEDEYIFAESFFQIIGICNFPEKIINPNT